MSLFPRCPDCPEYIMINNKKETVYAATCLKVISSETIYVDEPLIYTVDNIFHEHNPNIKIITWKCGAGHIFKTEGTKLCTGCIIEQTKANQEATEVANNENKLNKFNKFSNFDSHGKSLNTFNDNALI